MAAKKYLALASYLSLVVLLFYCGINLAEEGSKKVIGVQEPLQAFRIIMPQDDNGQLQIFWSGNSKAINISFISDKAGDMKNRLQSLLNGKREPADSP